MMPLYIRDDSVNALAETVMKATGAGNKTEAVRAALQAHLEAVQKEKPLLERMREVRSRADEIGAPDPTFDMKTFTDDMWGDG